MVVYILVRGTNHMSTPSKSVSYSSKNDNEIRRGPWTLEEDDVLIKCIANHGAGRWNLLAMSSGLRRTGKSCRLRWLNYLKPDIKRGNFTSEEQLLIFELHSKWGNRWSKIAQHLPGRTDNEIKNLWRTRIQKQTRHLKIDTNGTRFMGNVKPLRMIRCLNKSKETSPSTLSIQTFPFPLDGVSHYSAIETVPTQIPCQGTLLNEGGTNYLDQYEHYSESEHNSGLSMVSSESADISNMTQPLEYNTSQFQALDNSDFGICANDIYHINNNALNFTTTMVAAEDLEYQTRDCQISQSNWLDEEFAGSMWNMNELWQVRNMQYKK